MGLASLIVLTLGSFLPNAAWEIVRRGKSATKRAAIVPESKRVDGLPGSDVINEASLSVAIFAGDSVNLAASCQGSRSDRASVDRTVSGIPFLSSPTGANRKESNSDERLETEDEFVILPTKFHRLYRRHGADTTVRPHCCRIHWTQNMGTAGNCIKLGYYRTG
jgi:hypothetical protein